METPAQTTFITILPTESNDGSVSGAIDIVEDPGMLLVTLNAVVSYPEK